MEDYKRSYPEFEGSIIDWYDPMTPDAGIVKVKVALMDYHIGFTLVAPDDNDDLFACYNGPDSPLRKYQAGHIPLNWYDEDFRYLLSILQGNVMFDVGDTRCYREYQKNKGNAANLQASCAFNG